jgi:acyl-coenzyme A thioesterase PaaI-like protein
MDAVRRGLPAPPAGRTLGFQVLDVDPDQGRIEVAFEGTEAFTSPYGEVVQRDDGRAHLEATLSDNDGHVVATADATAEIVRRHPPDRSEDR